MKYNGNIDITYDQITQLAEVGLIGEIKDNKSGDFLFAHNGGRYLGAPGKEIYFCLKNLTDTQIDTLVQTISEFFPTKPPGNHVKYAAFLRYIQGCFEKQGCLRSKKDKKRMINEKRDWSSSFKFMEILRKNLEENNRLYGLTLWHEMTAHRYGDLAIIHPEDRYLNLEKMEHHYIESQRIGLSIKSWKHIFTPFYWAGHYFHEVSNKEKSVEYHKKNLDMMNKYCPDAREGYREKAKTSIDHLRLDMSGFDKWFKKFKTKVKNKCIKKII